MYINILVEGTGAPEGKQWGMVTRTALKWLTAASGHTAPTPSWEAGIGKNQAAGDEERVNQRRERKYPMK